MHMLTIIRLYLGLSQSALAIAAGTSHADVWEIESKAPFGRLGRYRRVAKALGLNLESLIKNDINSIPLSFFEEHPPQPYLPEPKSKTSLFGRQGEDYIFAREQARLSEILPIHAKLVIPFYKLKGQQIGCDILSFDNDGNVLCLEVKTSAKVRNTISLTKNELDAAQKLTEKGGTYIITTINNWGTPEQTVEDVPYSDFQDTHDITPAVYHCSPKKGSTMTGFAYYRKLRGLREREIADALDIRQSKWSLYETGEREPPVQVVMRASEFLDATIDELLSTYEEDVS